MKKSYIGIDPGKSGGLAVIVGGKVSHTTAMIISSDKEIDLRSTAEWIMGAVSGTQPIACIEKVHSMPKQGVASTFKFGYNVGIIHGILAALGIPRYTATPQQWKKVILVGTAKDKAAAVDFCRRVYPDVSLLTGSRSKKPHDGIADAICIARFISNHT